MTRSLRAAPGTAMDRALRRALGEFAASTVQLDTLDPITTELVRLRCARYHDCRICSSMRLVAARDAGLDESMADKVDQYTSSDLEDRHKAALRLADALMTQPGAIDTSLREELYHHFTAAQLLELTVDVMKWNYQKAPVSLGSDDALRPGELSDLVFDERGHWVRPG